MSTPKKDNPYDRIWHETPEKRDGLRALIRSWWASLPVGSAFGSVAELVTHLVGYKWLKERYRRRRHRRGE